MLTTVLLTITSFLGMLILLIFAHEFGHFITAKLTKVKVEEFGIGFPPRLFSFRKGETIYSLNAIPLGGFTKMAGEENAAVPDGLASKSIPVRVLVLTAGSLMNIALPVLLISASLMIPHNVVIEEVYVQEVAPNSPAQAAGIEPGDRIVSINGRPVNNRGDVVYSVQLHLGSEVAMLIEKVDGSQQKALVVPRWRPPEGQGATGILLTAKNTSTKRQAYPFWKAVPDSFVHCWEILVLFKNEIIGWFVRGTTPQLTGPIGIAGLTGQVAKAGLSPLLEFTALISINLAIINLFPFPGLDGGRLIFVFLEWVRRGKKISPKREGLIHLIGLAVLLALIVIVSYYDITSIIKNNSVP